MNEEKAMNAGQILILAELVTRIGLEASSILLRNLQSAKTIDDAIAALDAAIAKDWSKYKQDAQQTIPGL